MKCNQSRLGFELVSPCPFPTTITTTPRAPPAAKVCNLIEIEKVLWKNQNGFQANRSTTSQILTIRRIIEEVRTKNLVAAVFFFFFVDFSKAFDFIRRERMEQILQAYDLPKKTVIAIMILYRNTSRGTLTEGKHGFLRHFCWSSTRRYISTLSVYNLPRLRTLNVDRSNKKWLYTEKGKKADNIPQKL